MRPPVAGADGTGHGRGGGVGQEHHERDHGGDDRRGDGQAGEFGCAQVAHHRGVGEHEQRLREQGAEGRHGEAEQPSVSGVHDTQAYGGEWAAGLH